ncbi:MAG TPA: hypothetical protein VGM91_21765 [Conexibacter sp.]|jgi:hypothetical protein
MSDLVKRLGDQLVAAAERQAEADARSWRARLGWPRRASTRALLIVSAAVLAGAGGTAGVLATRGEVGGPPSLAFGRVSPQQQAAGIRALTRPVILARGRLPDDGRQWQLVGFKTTRGFCIDVDWPAARSSGGCGTNVPKGGRKLDWQGQILVGGGLDRGVVVGAVDAAAASVGFRWIHSVRRPALTTRARVIHVSDPRTLAAMGLSKPFAYYVAELAGPFFAMRAAAYDAHGALLQRIGLPENFTDTPGGGFSVPGRGCDPTAAETARTRLVHTLPPLAVRNVISPLRRPQRQSDLPPRSFVSGSSFEKTIEVDAIRRLGAVPGGGSLYLIPSTLRQSTGPGPGCLRTLTPSGRAFQARRAALIRHNTSGLRFSTMVLDAEGKGGGGGGGMDIDDIRTDALSYAALNHLAFGLLPDGVAHVDLRFAHGIRRSLDTPGNYWATRVPTGAGSTRLLSATWRAADGHVIRRARQR